MKREEVVDDVVEPQGDRPPASAEAERASPEEPGAAWIHGLAGEWQSRWQQAQYPQARSGASLLK